MNFHSKFFIRIKISKLRNLYEIIFTNKIKLFLGPINPIEHIFRPQQKPKPLGPQTPQQSTQSSAVHNLHGGFVPMLIKTANASIIQHFALKAAQTQSQSQTHLPSNQSNKNPFDQNTSIPFHPTFKAPNPDYSGFNISRYGDISPKGSLNNLKPVQLNKPLVPLPTRPNPERVNIPVRYRIKPQIQVNDKEFIISDSVLNANENIIPAKDVFHEYIDINDSNRDENDYMIAVERGSQSAESQSNPAFIRVQQINDKINSNVS